MHWHICPQAHSSFLVCSAGLDVVEFAMWWNPSLQVAHCDWESQRTPLMQCMNSRQSFASKVHLHDMLHTLEMLANDSYPSASSAFMPGLPLKFDPESVPQTKPAGIKITKGSCELVGARVMTRGECEDYAAVEKKHFIGSSSDTGEYAGCNVWEDTQLVEYNDHGRMLHECNIAPRGSCICKSKT